MIGSGVMDGKTLQGKILKKFDLQYRSTRRHCQLSM
jgi:hypothetical protein